MKSAMAPIFALAELAEAGSFLRWPTGHAMNKIEVSVGALWPYHCSGRCVGKFCDLGTDDHNESKRPKTSDLVDLANHSDSVSRVRFDFKLSARESASWFWPALPSLVISALAIIMAGLVWTE